MDAAVIGLIGVVVGALLAGILSWLNQRSQLAHDATQRLLEREHELRKTLLLEGAVGLQQAYSGLATLGKIDANLESASNDFAEGLSKLSLAGFVAKQNTLETVNLLISEIGLIFLKTLLSRKTLDGRSIDLNVCQQGIERYLAQQAQAAELMKEYNLSGNTDIHAFERLQRYFDHASAELNRLFDERDQLQKALDSATSDFMRSIIPLRENLAPLIVKSTVAIRSELGFPIDEAKMLRMSADSTAKAKIAIDEFIAGLYSESDTNSPAGNDTSAQPRQG